MSANNFSMIKSVFSEMVFPFWTRSTMRWKALALTALTFALILGIVWVLVQLNHWNQAFYDALQNLNKDEFLRQTWRFFFIVVTYVFLTAYRYYVLQNLGLLWRQWLTEQNLQHWLSQQSFYYWHLSPGSNDNPDQRLSDDLRELTELSLELAEKFFREGITFVSFIGILWSLSGSWKFYHVFGWDLELHKYLVVCCLLYAVFGTWLAHKVGRPLSKLNYLQERFEADFRYLLVRLRENSDSVALLKGENLERAKFFERFRAVVDNFKQVIRRQRNLLLTTNIYSQVAYIFPFLVASPKVFSREISFGQLFQITSAFQQVQGSVSVVVDMYDKIARWNSVVLRLGGFLESLNPERRALSPGLAIDLREVRLKTPQGQELGRATDFQVLKGERVLLKGSVGSGKSTLVKLLNGLWPYFEGQGQRPESTFTLPQKTYLPSASLKEALCYPSLPEKFTPEQLQEALSLVELPHLSNALETIAPWAEQLSSGEQQQLSFARLFLHSPQFMILDEATSAIDEATQKRLYQRLLQHLPEATVLSISHQDVLTAFHHRVVHWA